jgi:HK97 family phage major capsid protein
MNTQIVRGIRAVKANLDPKAVIADMQSAFQDFVARNDGKVSAIEAQLSAIETAVARGQLPGGGGNSKAVTADQKAHEKGFFAFIRKGVDDGLRNLEISAKLTTQSDPDGGYGVPTVIDNEIEKLETDAIAMRRIARVKQITTSDYKKLISAGGTASGWVGEEEARGETSTPILKQIAPTIGEIYANPAVTQTALDDVGFDVGEWLQQEISDEFADQEGSAFVVGNGVGKPMGILSYPTSANPDATRAWGTLQYIAGGAAATFGDPDKLVDLVHSLRAKYRQGACWLMNSKTIATIRKFKSGEGEYLWRDGLELGAPNSLLGYRVEEDENMPDIGAGAYPIAFGNFKRGYLIVDRKGIRILRDPLTNKPYVHFYTTKRVGGCCQNFQAIKLLKIAAS